jgi:L-asparaginase
VSVVLVATGGTISSLPDPMTGAMRPAVSAEDLIAGIPGIAALGDVEVIEIDRVSGWNVTPATMDAVARTLRERLADDRVEGAVVTHGTDTVEETAFLCDLLVESPKPVAFAAAMRSASELGADGPRNLLNALRVAQSPQALGWGALLVINDEVHAARWCRKVDSISTAAFASPGHGPVGYVTPDRIRIDPALARFTIELPDALTAEVLLVEVFTGMHEDLIEAAVDATGASGLVLDGTGAGNVPGEAMKGIVAAIERGLPVVVASRTLGGGAVPIYGGPGGGVTLRELGAIGAGGLTAAKARLLLMAALSKSADAAAACQLFSRAAVALAPGAFGAA